MNPSSVSSSLSSAAPEAASALAQAASLPRLPVMPVEEARELICDFSRLVARLNLQPGAAINDSTKNVSVTGRFSEVQDGTCSLELCFSLPAQGGQTAPWQELDICWSAKRMEEDAEGRFKENFLAGGKAALDAGGRVEITGIPADCVLTLMPARPLYSEELKQLSDAAVELLNVSPLTFNGEGYCSRSIYLHNDGDRTLLGLIGLKRSCKDDSMSVEVEIRSQPMLIEGESGRKELLKFPQAGGLLTAVISNCSSGQVEASAALMAHSVNPSIQVANICLPVVPDGDGRRQVRLEPISPL